MAGLVWDETVGAALSVVGGGGAGTGPRGGVTKPGVVWTPPVMAAGAGEGPDDKGGDPTNIGAGTGVVRSGVG